MGLPRPELAGWEETCSHRRWELAGRETGRGSYRRRWDGGNWQVGRWEEEFGTGDGTSKVGTGRQGDGKRNFTTGDGTSKVGTGRFQGDGKRNLLQEMGHPRETNLPHDMGLPRPELAGTGDKKRNLMGLTKVGDVGHPRLGNWQVGRWEEEFST